MWQIFNYWSQPAQSPGQDPWQWPAHPLSYNTLNNNLDNKINDHWIIQVTLEQAGAELGQAQLKRELELSFTWFKFYCIKLIDKNTTDYFDCH